MARAGHNSPPTTDPFTWAAGDTPDGTWTISARWRDVAGNVSDTQSVTLALDRNGPVGTLEINGGAQYTNSMQVQIAAQQSSSGSPAVRYLLSNDPALTSGVLANGQTFSTARPCPGLLPETAEGPQTVYAQWQDALGRWSPVASATITFDRTAPSVSPPYPAFIVGSTVSSAAILVIRGHAGDRHRVWRGGHDDGGVTQRRLLEPGAQRPEPGSEPDRRSTRRRRGSSARAAVDNAGNQSLRLGRGHQGRRDGGQQQRDRLQGQVEKSSNSQSSSGNDPLLDGTRGDRNADIHRFGCRLGRANALKDGRAKVLIDGVLVTKVDLGCAPQRRIVVFGASWTRSARHTITIKVVRTNGRPRVDLDSLIVLS